MTFLPSIVCWTGDSIVWVTTSIGSPSMGRVPDSCPCLNVSSGSVWHDKRSEKGENWIKIKNFEKNTLAASGGEMEGLTSSAILEASVVSTKIGSFWGSADEGLVDADLNAWDNSSTPRVGWDATVDNCEERNGIRSWISFWEEDELFYLGSRWSRSAKSFPSNGFLGCHLGRLALWRLIRYNCGGSMSFHQLLQWRCSWSYFWSRAWWLIIYRMPLPVYGWGIGFSV